jgi:hypothetical protein
MRQARSRQSKTNESAHSAESAVREESPMIKLGENLAPVSRVNGDKQEDQANRDTKAGRVRKDLNCLGQFVGFIRENGTAFIGTHAMGKGALFVSGCPGRPVWLRQGVRVPLRGERTSGRVFGGFLVLWLRGRLRVRPVHSDQGANGPWHRRRKLLRGLPDLLPLSSVRSGPDPERNFRESSVGRESKFGH